MAFLYVASARFMEQQIWETIGAEIIGLREQYTQRGLNGLIRTIGERAHMPAESDSVYLLVDRFDRVLAGNLLRWPDNAKDAHDGFSFELPLNDSDAETRALQSNLTPGLPVLARAFLLRDDTRLLVGRSIEQKMAIQERLRNAILLGAILMIVLSMLSGYIVSRWMLSRLERINRTTRRIMAGDLSRRIAVAGSGDEFDELASNVNAMLERIERLLVGMRQVTDSIAHDLRTPLNRLRSRIEVALIRDSDEMVTRQLLEETVRDADGLIETFNALLRIARLEAGAQHSDWEPVDLNELARDVAELYEPLAEEKSIDLSFHCGPEARANGNRQLLAQAIANLTDNAIKYTQDGGKITISTKSGKGPAIVVADNGPGIPPELRSKALERFGRLTPERSGPGNGLGLSLVQAVTRLHEANLELEGNDPGLRVTIRFPKKRTTPTPHTSGSTQREAT